MLSSSKFDKYEYLTGKDLGYKSGTIEQAKFEYSPLYQIFNKDLEREMIKQMDFWRSYEMVSVKMTNN